MRSRSCMWVAMLKRTCPSPAAPKAMPGVDGDQRLFQENVGNFEAVLLGCRKFGEDIKGSLNRRTLQALESPPSHPRQICVVAA